MATELTQGQNCRLPGPRLEIRLSAGHPVIAGATLSDEDGRVPGPEWVAHPGSPIVPGLEAPRRAAAQHRLAVDLGAMPEPVCRVNVLIALLHGIGGPERFGGLPAPYVAVAGLDGTEIAGYTITGLDTESAVVALELYRRQGAWKVRAVGQGYAGGLAELLTDQGLPQARELAGTINEAVAEGMPRPVQAPPPLSAEGDRSRRAAAPAFGPDQGRTAPQDDSPMPPNGGQTPGGPGQPAPQPPAYPGGTPDPSAAPRPTAASGGPIDYSHPRRQNAAPPTPPPTAPPAAPGQPRTPIAGDATGWSMDERLYNQVWGMFEDLARTTAAYRGAVDFADSRRDKELEQLLSDPRSRIGGQGDAAREAARARHAQLVAQAREAFDRDLAQLTAEAEVVEPALPPAYARWDSPAWHAYRVPTEIPMAVRLGNLHLPEADPIRIPMLARLPLERGLWIDSGRTVGRTGPSDGSSAEAHALGRLAMEAAVAHAARLLAVHPAGEFAVHVIDPAGSGAGPLAPLVRTGVLAAPPALGAAGVADVLARLTQRVDLVQMAVRGGAADSLPPGFDTSQQVLIVNDFPHGFDDRAVNQLRYLADEGPAFGVHLMIVADREESSAYGPLLDPLWRSLLRLTPVADDHLADPWVGHAWTYEPPLVPPGSQVLQQVLTQVAAARAKHT
ncbi:TerD family protein [Streptomyces sp. NRRL S-474]|uniref:TerD family protein n=1 Tax=Streptomyces sp. NRRL S-474 TaxID=1463909 RepID=UPI0004C74012|nr:TerD family protein [Streptomyces sp. NRRL S-474]